MERRLLLAIVLMIGLMVVSNILFPPIEPPPGPPGADSAALAAGADTVRTPADTAVEGEPAESAPAPPPAPDSLAEVATRLVEPAVPDTAETGAEVEEDGEIVPVRSELYEYRFDARGARLVGATLFEYENFTPGGGGGPVELIRAGDAVFGYRIAVRRDTLPLEDLRFETGADEVRVEDGPTEVTFRRAIAGSPLVFSVTYTFVPDDYRIDVRGRLEGLGDSGYTLLTGLGRGLRTNEANPDEDHGQMAVVVHPRTGDIDAENLRGVEPEVSRVLEGGPFAWAASKSKYFLVAVVSPEDGPGIGGVLLDGLPEEHATEIDVALPVPAGSDGFGFTSYVGPQVFDRLRAIGQDLHNVNPFGWRILQWFIRPFGALVIAILVWMHNAFTLAYGWVLILFGVLTRIVLFPLYQKSMRQQMKQMAIQPEIKRIQAKYKEDPQKLQQEMMKVYKESGVNPLGGCLPMLVPFPILITLFFVFQNTIEFRGVPFWWIPDLSLKDPLYIVPLIMGASMLLLNWIGQRGMETNPQMKMFTYVLPVVFTFMFAQFAAGLNLYYAASNVASLPQQLYLSKERRAARAKMGSGSAAADAGGGSGSKRAAKGGGRKKASGGAGRARRGS